MKKSQLKPLIKEVLKQLQKRKLNESTGTLDDYEIEFENLVIPGISNDGDVVTVEININYEATPDVPERGMFGPPENASPAEAGDFSIIDWDINLITVQPENGQSTQINNFRQFTPEQWISIKTAVNGYIEENEEKIASNVLDTKGDNISEPEEPDYFEDR